MRFAPALVLACTTFTLAPLANAAQWYVAPGGHGDGTSPASAFDTIQKGLDAAQPGDAVIVATGTYDESIQTVRDGTDSAAITLTAETGANVVITSSGRVLRVDHAYFSVREVVFDGQYGESDVLDINDGATGFVLSRSEVRHSGRDCVDMGAPSDVLIDRCQIHHCLDSREGRTDAHGVTGGAVRNLTLRDTTVHTFSGDGIQLDPGRELPGWDGLVIEGCEIRLEPLSQSENGFPQGTVPGENAVDTKTNDDAPRANLTITDTIARGFRGGLISNMAAFNLKENVDVLVDRVTVTDSEIAFRLRGPGSHPGAWVRLQNAVVYDVDVAVRYEDDIENLRVYNATFGRDIGSPFVNASSDASVLDVRNLLLLGDAMPAEGAGSTSNLLATDAFFPTAGYTLTDNAAAIDAGEAIDGVTHDRAGTERPQGGAVDVGAYEWCEGGCAGNTGGNAGASTGGSGGSATGGSGGAAGENGTGGTSGDAGAGGSGQGASAGSAGAPAPSAGDTSDDGGCGCRAARTPINAWWALMVAGLWLAWRRRRTSIARC